MEPELLLRNSVGDLVATVGTDTTFDLRQPAMRKVFVDDALYGASIVRETYTRKPAQCPVPSAQCPVPSVAVSSKS